MKITHYKDIAPDPVGEEGAAGIGVRWVISERDGAQNFAMRVFEMAPGGHSPYHSHSWEHEVFILKGTASLVRGEGDAVSCSEGTVIFIAPNERHQFKNLADESLEFICLIPTIR